MAAMAGLITLLGPATCRLCLNASIGPNAALLVAAGCVKARVPCRISLNQIRVGDYAHSVTELEEPGLLCVPGAGLRQMLTPGDLAR